MRRGRVRLELGFPAGVEPGAALAAVDGLAGISREVELVAEVAASEGHIQHAFWVPGSSVAMVRSLLCGAIPSLRLSPTEALHGPVTLAVALRIPRRVVLQTANLTEVSRALLVGMTGLRGSERLVLRWALRGGTPPVSDAEPEGRRQRELERVWRRKLSAPGLFASGVVLAYAKSWGRARELADQLEAVIRARRGVLGTVALRSVRRQSLASLPHVSGRSGWLSGVELAGLLAWPLGEAVPGVTVGGRELPAAPHLPRTGRRLFMGRDHGGERWVALAPAEARLHTVVAGSSGSGKSELLARGIVDEIAAGHAGAVIDPKADLIQTVLEHLPAAHADRVVVLDPGDATRPTPGVDVLRGGDPDLRTDVLIGALKSIFTDWGIRSETYGRLALRSLAEVPGTTLGDAGRLFSDEAFLRQVITRLHDPYLIEAWKQYLALPAGSKSEHVQAPMARVAALLARPRVRAVLANPHPTLDIGRLFTERKWLLVSLAPGTLGETGASIVGAALTHLIWSAVEARVALPPERRHLISIYLDELATLTGGVPFSFELLAERARGLGAALTVAVQTLGRIPEPTRSALLGNAGNFISFAAAAEEAPRIARQLPGLTEGDVMTMRRFGVAARLSASGAVSTVTGRTLPLPTPSGQAAAVRDASARAYATTPDEAVSAPSAPAPEGAQTQQLGRTGRAA